MNARVDSIYFRTRTTYNIGHLGCARGHEPPNNLGPS